LKEFYLYTLKASYIEKFKDVEPQLLLHKGATRPAVCVKDLNGQNWLIPMTSLDPAKSNYPHKIQTISSQERLEASMPIKAIMRFNDLSGVKSDKDFEDVLQFFKAIPVKQEYVNRLTNRWVHLQSRLSETERQTVKSNLLAYLSRYSKGYASGFLYRYQQNNTDISKYQYNVKEIRRELYREQYRQRREQKERRKRAAELAGKKEHKKELKEKYLEAAAAGLTELNAPEESIPHTAAYLLPLVEKNVAAAKAAPGKLDYGTSRIKRSDSLQKRFAN
jgi:hypothetical protein